jgi:7,8-dihydropterin-6-yl-methyl-4-(beta-D-ribofuranosyl)aminobenzene 5'-phosphate synthase
MELTVLVDNNTLIDRYFLGEPGVSFFLEDEGTRILFDLGYSDAFLINANKMGIDLLNLDWIVLSHGHLDHTWGMGPLLRAFTESMIEKRPCKRPKLAAHPEVFTTKTFGDLPEIGSLFSKEKIGRHLDLMLSREPIWLTDRLVFLGEIPRIFAFEEGTLGNVEKNGELVPDPLKDDSSLAYLSPKGLVIIAGCAHAGICNTIEYARKVCDQKRVFDVIGGFHLQNPTSKRMEQTAGYLTALGLSALHPCHCTDLISKIALAAVLPVLEVGSGLRLSYP